MLCQLYFSDRNAPIEEVKNAFFDPRHLNDRAPISEEDKTDFARKLHQVKHKISRICDWYIISC